MKAQLLKKFGISDSSPKVSVRAAGLPLLMAVVRRAAGTLRRWKEIAGVSLLLSVTAAADVAQQAYLKAAVPHASDNFGHAMALDGDTLVAGAPVEDGNSGNDEGAVYVFVRQAGAWVEQAKLKANNPGAGDLFGLSVSLAGDTLVVGAQNEDSNDSGINHTLGGGADDLEADAGAAYVFVRSGGTWTQQAYLKSSSPDPGDLFGVSVGISGDTVVVGARDDDGLATNAGAAYLFVRSGSTWSQQQIVRASNGGSSNRFGASVGISGNTIVAGAYGHDGGINNAGAAYVFVRSGTTWSQQAYLLATNRGDSDLFGLSVAISGETIVVGARDEDSNATGVGGSGANNSAVDSGAAYVFTRSGTSWGTPTYLKASNTGAGDQFSEALAIHGDTIVVGSLGEDSNATGINGNQADNSAAAAGAAYVFKRSGGTWSHHAYLKASNTGADDLFAGMRGMVAVSGDLVTCGAIREDSSAAGVDGDEGDNSLVDPGAAYLFHLNAPRDIRVESPAGMSLKDGVGTVNFGTAPQGVPGTRVIRVKNAGGEPLQVSGISVSSGFECVGLELPFSLAPGEARDVTVRFLANGSIGPWNGSLTVVSDDPDEEGSFALSLTAWTGRRFPSSLDTSFSVDGRQTTAVGPNNDQGNDVVIQPDGKILVVGSSWTGVSYDLVLVRYLATGELDPAFGTGGIALLDFGGWDDGTALALRPDGKIIVVGSDSNDSNSDFALARFLPDGQLDTTFGTNGKVITVMATNNADSATDVALQGDGKIVVGGYAFSDSTYFNIAVARYTADGVLDTGFSGDGKLTTDISGDYDYGNALALQSDGRILVVGSSSSSSSAPSNFLAVRYTAGGVLDTDFSGDGKLTIDFAGDSDAAHDVIIQPDGKIIVAGSAWTGTGSDFALARLTASGGLDSSFGTGGKVVTHLGNSSFIYGLALQSDGAIVAGGTSGHTFSYDHDFGLARYTREGALDATFGFDGTVLTFLRSGSNSCNAVALQADGRIVAAGSTSFGTSGSGYDIAVVRYGVDLAPTIDTMPASSLTSTGALLNGYVSTKGVLTSVWFEYGGTTAYGNLTASQDVGYGTAPVPFAAGITGLLPGSTYHYRVVVQSGNLTFYGADVGFTTLPAINPAWASAGFVPVTAAGYTATGGTFGVPVLSFVPSPGTMLTVVKNTARGFIDGEFNDLAQGQKVPLTYNGVTYNFTANYHGGTGNDLVLQWAGMGAVTWGQQNFDSRNVHPPYTAIAAGNQHTLALRKDGTVAAWGSNLYGETTVPETLTGVISVAAGQYHSVALKRDGTVAIWGTMFSENAEPPAGLNGVVAVAGGENHAMALKNDGTVVSWGNNYYGQTSVPAGLGGVTAIAAGDRHAVALRSDGTVVAWGKNDYGQAEVPAGLSGVVAIAAGVRNTLAVKSDGTVIGWGDNEHERTIPPEGLSGVVALSAGTFHTAALKSDGTVVVWGADFNGLTTVPAGLSGVVAVAAGRSCVVALKDDGTTTGWGDNYYGQSVEPSGVSQLVTIASAYGHQAAVRSDGSVVTWGLQSPDDTPMPAGLDDAVAIVSGGRHTALKRDGTVVEWGDDAPGWTGVPPGLEGVVSLAGGGAVLALKNDGTVASWGYGGFDSLPPGLDEVIAVAAGGTHSVALKSDGTVVAWGGNHLGQTDVPAGLTGVVAISAGNGHTVALKSDGTVAVWGDNSVGQTEVPPGLTGVSAVVAGYYHTAALKNDGTVVAWGLNYFGESSVPEDLHDVVSIAAGARQTTALKQDGTVVSWGADVSRMPELHGVAAISAGYGSSTALVPLPPKVILDAPQSLTSTGVTLHGRVNPEAQITSVQFEYSADGSFTSSASVTLASTDGTAFQDISANLNGLLPGTSYHYRLTASSVSGTSTTGDLTFTTPGPGIALFDGPESPSSELTNGQSTAVDFGNHPQPMTGVSRTFTVKNTGTAPLTLFSVSATPMSEFQVQGMPLSPIPPGEGRTILVHFSSNTAGDYSGALSILSNATTGSLFSVPIRGAVVDQSPPWLTQVSLSGFGSNPSYPGHLKAGAMISLSILSNEPIQPPVVEICGKPAQVGESFGGTSWFAHVTVDETFPQGQASISVTATDLAGNTAPPVTFPTSGMMVTVDTVPPAILSSSMSSSNPAPGWAKAGDTIYAGFTMSEEIVSPSFTVFGAPWMGTVMSSPGTVSIISNPIMAEPEGPVAVSFQCVDRAGNSADFSTISFFTPVVVDRTPPLITQGDMTAELTGSGGTAVAFSPTATDALGAIASITSTPPSGSFFSPGITSISVQATDSAGNTGTGTFNITLLAAGDFWRDTYFDQTANSGDAADDADPDNDGVVNLIERAFNLHPLQAGRPVLTAGGGTGGLPLVTVLGEGENRRLRVEYLRRKADSLPGLTYTPQFSTMLDEEWAPVVGESVSSINDLWERVTVDDAPGAVRSFGRVKVTSP